ncbi:MAG: rod shape-determining protein MreC [Terriglobales bacterium]
MFTRYRQVTLLGVMVLAQLLLLAYQIRRPDGRGVRLLRVWSVRAVLPVARASHAAVGEIESLLHTYVLLHHARLQASTLAAELRRAQLANLQLRAAAAQNARLNTLLGFHPRQVARLLPAVVIGGSASPESQVLYLNRGSAEGVARNMPVLCPAGVVGKITQTFTHDSEVLLITDPASGVGAMLANDHGHGVLWGRGPGQAALRFLSNHEPARQGEAVITSGEDQIFPAGLPLGTITGLQPGQPFWRVTVRPVAPIAELDAVFIAIQLRPQPAVAAAPLSLTAAQILSHKLPSIPHEPFNPPTGPPVSVTELMAERAAASRPPVPSAPPPANQAAPTTPQSSAAAAGATRRAAAKAAKGKPVPVAPPSTHPLRPQ